MMKDILEKLCQHHTISLEESKNILIGIAQGEYDPVLVASFLTIFRMRNVTVDELLGFREAMLELAICPDLGVSECIDVCGTGGDGKDTFNISTISAFVIAGAGVNVAKHGNVAVSSSCGSSDVLLELGVNFLSEESQLRKQIEQTNITYLHAPLFHPAMKNVAPIRKALGVRTFFNLLGPLVNPGKPQGQLIGVFSMEIARLFHNVLARTGQRYCVVHSLDGYDEVSLTGEWAAFLGGGETLSRSTEEGVTPVDLGIEKVMPQAICGGKSKDENAQLFVTILNGNGSREQNDVVAVNAAYGIQVAKENLPFQEALALARESLMSGSALRAFEGFRDISQE